MADDQHNSRLTYYICIAIVAAIALALLKPEWAQMFEVGGELFLRSLKMIVVPLVFTSVMCGILGLGDVRKLGKPGAVAIGYYMLTTFLAVLIGLAVVNVLQPGVGTVDAEVMEGIGQEDGSAAGKLRSALATSAGVSEDAVGEVFDELSAAKESTPDIWTVLRNLALMLVTDNLFGAAANTQLLPIIVFAIVLAALMTTMAGKVNTLVSFVREANDVLMKFVLLLMNLAPVGIFCLVTARFGEAAEGGRFWAELSQIGWYFAAVLIGLGIHVFVALPLIYWVVRRENPYKYLMAMSRSLLTAFSTASSSATLPITMECVEEAGVSKKSAEFVVPLGATINMDGTALYEAVAAIFIAQALAFNLDISGQMVIAVTATLAAIGAAGIPEAGLVTMLIVLNAVGLPIEYIGLILTVDWLLDRFRTAANCWGDAVGASIVEKALPQE